MEEKEKEGGNYRDQDNGNLDEIKNELLKKMGKKKI